MIQYSSIIIYMCIDSGASLSSEQQYAYEQIEKGPQQAQSEVSHTMTRARVRLGL